MSEGEEPVDNELSQLFEKGFETLNDLENGPLETNSDEFQVYTCICKHAYRYHIR